MQVSFNSIVTLAEVCTHIEPLYEFCHDYINELNKTAVSTSTTDPMANFVLLFTMIPVLLLLSFLCSPVFQFFVLILQLYCHSITHQNAAARPV